MTYETQFKDNPNVQAVIKMLEAWHALDLDGAVNMFTEDGVFHSMMREPHKGRDVLRGFMGKLFGGMSELSLEIRSEGVSGNTVILERFDSWVFNGKPGSIPVVGVYDVEDGKIKEWREYYDYAALMGEMGITGTL